MAIWETRNSSSSFTFLGSAIVLKWKTCCPSHGQLVSSWHTKESSLKIHENFRILKNITEGVASMSGTGTMRHQMGDFIQQPDDRELNYRRPPNWYPGAF